MCNKKILIWGTGQLAWQTVKNLDEKDIIGYVDTYKKKEIYVGKKVYKPSEILEIEYDAILVSTIFGKEIKDVCQNEGIPLDRVIFVYGNVITEDLNKDYNFVQKICGEKFAVSIEKRYHLIREIDEEINNSEISEIDLLRDSKLYRSDYVRLKNFELLVREINKRNVEGEIAELGVFQGDFAQFLSVAFENRKLYLFDTFEGFDEEELNKELKGDIMLSMRDTYKATSINLVMSKMKHQSNVVIKQGFFPASLNGLEEKFAFVSLDCDWEESLYQGLLYFYPRLSVGGYIMIHDYNNSLVCAEKAVTRYEKEYNVIIPKVPICDTQGSLILTKGK